MLLRAQGEPDYIEDITILSNASDNDSSISNEMEMNYMKKLLTLVKSEGKSFNQFLQRKLQIGYNRAARIVDMMEEKGVVGKANHVGKREVL